MSKFSLWRSREKPRTGEQHTREDASVRGGEREEEFSFLHSIDLPNFFLRGSNASVNSTCSQAPPGQLRGIFPPCQSRGWGISKFCAARGLGICQPPGHSRAFDTHTVSYQNITTQKVLLEKSRLAHLSRTGINCRGL